MRRTSRYRRRRRQPTCQPLYRYNRVPRSIAANNLYLVPAGLQARTINPGDCWVKRRIARTLTVPSGSAGNFTFADIWNAIVCGPTSSGPTAVNQPYSTASAFDIRIKSFYIYCYKPTPFECRINEATIMADKPGSSNLRSFFAFPASGVSWTKMAFKIPVPQQLVVPQVTSSSSNVTIFSLFSQSTTTESVFYINVSLKYKI